MAMHSVVTMAALLQIIVIAIAFSSGDALECYQCNSAVNYEGEECKTVVRYDNTSTAPKSHLLKPCVEDSKDTHKYERCRVIVQDVDGEERVIRSCATWPDHNKPNRCIDRTGTAKIKIQYCECEGDGCNGSSALFASALTLVLAIFIGKSFF
jgi:hypothetical protein